MNDESNIKRRDVTRMLRTVYRDMMNWVFVGTGIMVWLVSGNFPLGAAVTAITCLPYNEFEGNYAIE